jgi:ATP-dependent DNA helicase RecQ
MQFLDRQGIVTLSTEFTEKITLQFLISSKEVMRYMSLNPKEEEIILTVLRTYPGIYDLPTAFNLALIAKKSNRSESEVNQLLQKLHEKEIISYQAKNNDAVLVFNEIREDEKTINRVAKYLEHQNQLKIDQLHSVLNYVNDTSHCKSQLLVSYFGEKDTTACGICSYCIGGSKPTDITSTTKKILELLKTSDLNSREIEKLSQYAANDVIFALQMLLENEVVVLKANNQYTLKK